MTHNHLNLILNALYLSHTEITGGLTLTLAGVNLKYKLLYVSQDSPLPQASITLDLNRDMNYPTVFYDYVENLVNE